MSWKKVALSKKLWIEWVTSEHKDRKSTFPFAHFPNLVFFWSSFFGGSYRWQWEFHSFTCSFKTRFEGGKFGDPNLKLVKSWITRLQAPRYGGVKRGRILQTMSCHGSKFPTMSVHFIPFHSISNLSRPPRCTYEQSWNMLKLILKRGDNHSSHPKKTSSSQAVEIKKPKTTKIPAWLPKWKYGRLLHHLDFKKWSEISGEKYI